MASSAGQHGREGCKRLWISLDNSPNPQPSERAIERSDREGLLSAVARRYRLPLNSFFRRRLGADREECEDLTQEVLLRLSNQAHLHEVDRIEPYLFRAASGVLVDHVRRRRVRGGGLGETYDEERHAPADFSPERVLLGKEEVEGVLAAIETLPERARHALVLCKFEGLRQAEIARRMGISVSAVEKHLRLAMVRVVAALEDRA